METLSKNNKIRVAIAGVGNCAGSLVEGVNFYKKTGENKGLLFEKIGNYFVSDIEFVLAFDNVSI